MSLPPPAPTGLPPPSVPPALRPPLRPRWWWYLVAGGILLAALAGAAVTTVVTLVNWVDELERIRPGTTEELDLGEGGYTIYFEEWANVAGDGRTWAEGAIRITAEDGTPVELIDYDGTFTYNSGSRHGRAVLTFHADHSGDYHVSIAERTSTGEGTIVVGPGFRTFLRRAIRRAVTIVIGGLITSVALTVAIAIRRASARRPLAS